MGPAIATCRPTTRRRASPTASTTGSASVRACRSNMPMRPCREASAGAGLTEFSSLSGTGWGYGFTAGVTLTPMPSTHDRHRLSLGDQSEDRWKCAFGSDYLARRPRIRQHYARSARCRLAGSAPDVSVRSGLCLAPSNGPTGAASAHPMCTGPTGAIVGHFAVPILKTAGSSRSAPNIMWNDRLTVRAGVGYEKSPITDQVRIPLLPDNDRYWLSLGGSYKLTPKMSFDLAYSHLFVKSTLDQHHGTSGNPWFNPATPSAISAPSTRTSTSSRWADISLGRAGAGAEVAALSQISAALSRHEKAGGNAGLFLRRPGHAHARGGGRRLKTRR